MKKQVKSILAAVSAIAVAAVSGAELFAPLSSEAAYGVGGNGTAIMEYLDRGIYAVKSGNGMFVSWRYNADDADDAEFRLYRDNTLIYTSKSGDATSYQDNGGTTSSKYRVDTVSGGKVISSQNCNFTSGSSYFDINLNSPGTQYSPNDCCVGDVDGDGQYEIFLKWDPSNSKDNSQSGNTDRVYIDCYTLQGKQLWRVDLGQNIRAGQHYTQMCVADFDCDGKAELITKTADGTKDGVGTYIGDKSKNYANGEGYVLSGPEYMTLFEGATGKALDTIDFPVPRGKVSDWGDNYGNRVDRFNGGIAYLDGVHPTAIYGRGYYTRLTWSAVDVKNGKLSVRWIYDSGKSGAYANGNHNVMAADVDNDGKQEIFTGAACIDDNGKLLWVNGRKHGDAMHLGDLDPSREGLEAWVCHEETHGMSLLDAKTGDSIFHIDASGDTGRCCGDNVYAGNKGAELWGAANGNTYNVSGKTISGSRPAQNFLIYWDGDLEREILDGTKITKMTSATKFDTLLNATDCGSNNGSKSVPCLTADLFGDWREELILRTTDNKKLRIWCTTAQTKVRLTTLMHDMQYRAQAACEQSCYNQPPHASYYLGSDVALPARPKVVINGKGTTPVIDPGTQPTTEPETPKNPGDLNKDGAVDIFDLMALKKLIVSGKDITSNGNSDMNADGKLSIADAVSLQSFILGGKSNASGNLYYASDMAIESGVTETVNAGFTGASYVNLDNMTGSALTWKVNAASAGTYNCTFRVANGSADNRPMNVSVNGGAGVSVNFETTGAWTTWTDVTVQLTLNQGENTIKMTSLTAGGGPNLDILTLN